MNWSMFVLGLLTLAFGCSMIIKPKYYSFRYARYFDFSTFHVAYGIGIIAVGILFIWFAFRTKPSRLPAGNIILVCPECGQPYNSSDVIDRMCPNCLIQLEDLEGFYERHPEQRNDTQ